MESGQGGSTTDIQLSRCYPGCDTAQAAGLLPWGFYNNNDSVLENNAAGMLSSATLSHNRITFGKSIRNNFDMVWHNEEAAAAASEPVHSVFSVYRDPPSGDFRPRIGSPLIDAAGLGSLSAPVDGDGALYHGAAADIGAYEYNSTVYWLPGPQTAAPSMPVPFHMASDVLPDADLMFLHGADAVAHDVRLWEPASGGEVATATSSRLHAPTNIHRVLGSLEAGKSYQWRVDAVKADGSVVPGPVWSFATFGALDLQILPTDDSYTHVYERDANFGAEERLQVRKTGGASAHRTSFLRFDMGRHGEGLRLGLLARIGELLVKSVVLRLRVKQHQVGDVTLWDVVTSEGAAGWKWNESSLTYNNAPALGSAIATLNGDLQFEPEQFVEFNLTARWPPSKVLELLSGGGSTTSFALTTSGTTPSYGMGFYSKEISEVESRPVLLVELQAPTPPPTASPSAVPSAHPTAAPTDHPTPASTAERTVSPTEGPTAEPTKSPTAAPTAAPTKVSTGSCDKTAYFNAVKVDCAAMREQCNEELQATADDARAQKLCGEDTNCAQYFECASSRMASTGCDGDTALAAPLQAIRRGCSAFGEFSDSKRAECKKQMAADGGALCAGR
jgi:hypothetical protein